MKYLITILFLIICTTTNAQVQTDTAANKFAGTWRWTSGTDTVIIVLEKQVYTIPFTGASIERLVGWHRYIKNGQVVESSLQYVGRDINIDFNSNDQDLKTTLRGNTRTPNRVLFRTFWDLTLHKDCYLYFTLVQGSTTQAVWELTDPQGIYGGPIGTIGKFTLPKNLILNKL